MADITDPRVIRFCNESVRIMAEKMRELDYFLDDMKRRWDNEISGIISGNANEDVILDGRASEGVSILTKADLVNFMNQVNIYNAQMSNVGVRDVIQKPCVRAIGVI